MSEVPTPITDVAKIDPDTVWIKLISWSKYKNKKGIKQGTWFRLECDILEHPKIQKLSPKHFMLFLKVISNCSRKQMECIQINSRMILVSCRIASKTLPKALFSLQEAGLIELFAYNPLQLNPTQPNSTHYNSENFLVSSSESQPQPLRQKVTAPLSPEMSFEDQQLLSDDKPLPDLLGLWRRICGKKFRTPTLLSRPDEDHLLNRWSERPDIKIWETAFKNLVDDRCIFFHPSSREKIKNWKPTFGWLIKGTDEFLMKAYNGDWIIEENQDQSTWDIESLVKDMEP